MTVFARRRRVLRRHRTRSLAAIAEIPAFRRAGLRLYEFEPGLFVPAFDGLLRYAALGAFFGLPIAAARSLLKKDAK